VTAVKLSSVIALLVRFAVAYRTDSSGSSPCTCVGAPCTCVGLESFLPGQTHLSKAFQKQAANLAEQSGRRTVID
jgi:hypothetical protein